MDKTHNPFTALVEGSLELLDSGADIDAVLETLDSTLSVAEPPTHSMVAFLTHLEHMVDATTIVSNATFALQKEQSASAPWRSASQFTPLERKGGRMELVDRLVFRHLLRQLHLALTSYMSIPEVKDDPENARQFAKTLELIVKKIAKENFGDLR